MKSDEFLNCKVATENSIYFSGVSNLKKNLRIPKKCMTFKLGVEAEGDERLRDFELARETRRISLGIFLPFAF